MAKKKVKTTVAKPKTDDTGGVPPDPTHPKP